MTVGDSRIPRKQLDFIDGHWLAGKANFRVNNWVEIEVMGDITKSVSNGSVSKLMYKPMSLSESKIFATDALGGELQKA